MDKSLEEIIQSKKPVGKTVKRGFINKNSNAGRTKPFVALKTTKIVDARLKIIQNNRAKIRDARDKLVQKSKSCVDARFKLLARKQFIFPSNGLPRGNYRQGNGRSPDIHARTLAPPMPKPKIKFQMMRRGVGGAPLPDVVEIPHGYIDYDNMDRLEEDEYDTSNLRRTVQNDIMPHFSVPYIPTERRGIEPNWANDPFNVYELPIRGSGSGSSSEPIENISIRRDLRNMSPEMQPKSILRRYQQEQPPSHLSYEMRSRLEHAPDPHASVGIFSNPLKPQPSTDGFRIVVSNLHNSVSQSDIKELFEDIGELYEARLVRPGVSEVIYKNLKDAEKAVDTYHNRQLDGQPMKCLLVNPRSSNIPSGNKNSFNSSSGSSRSTSSKTPLEIDIDALHKVLFRRQNYR